MEQKTVPNQQIVIAFSDKMISAEDTENAIEAIQNKLQSIGVSQIKIGQYKDGELRITYHSKADIAHIKNVLFETENYELAYEASRDSSNKGTNSKKDKYYELNITEIKSSSSVNWDFEGTQVTEINQKTDNSNPVNIDYSSQQINAKQLNAKIKNAVLVNKVVTHSIDTTSYKIPEVRAGPVT